MQRQKREFNIVMSGQFCTLAMFFMWTSLSPSFWPGFQVLSCFAMWDFWLKHPTIVYFVRIFGYLGDISLWCNATTTSLFVSHFCRRLFVAFLQIWNSQVAHSNISFHIFCRIFVILTNALQQKFHIC